MEMTVYKLTHPYDDHVITLSFPNEEFGTDSLIKVLSYIMFRVHDLSDGEKDLSNEQIGRALVEQFNATPLDGKYFGLDINLYDLWESNCGHYDEVMNNVPINSAVLKAKFDNYLMDLMNEVS
jgi:hypothetical protein